MSFNRVVELSIADVLIKDLRITFDIKKSVSSSANIGKINIYNLRDETTKKIIESNSTVILRAGYEDEGGAKNIFFGNIISALDSFKGTERILEVEALDGIQEIKDKTFSRGYKQGTGIKQIFNDLTAVIGLPARNTASLSSIQYTNGFSASGYALDILERVLAYDGKSYTIQNNELVILAPNETYTSTGLVLSKETGLIDTPQELRDSSDVSSTESPQKWSFKSLLYPDLIPGGVVSLQSEKINGVFKLESTNFKGDNFGNDFLVMCEAREL